MDSSERKIIKDDILDITIDNLEEIWVIGRYCLLLYIRCLITFGKENKVTKDVKNIWNEFLEIIKEEKNLLEIISKSLKKLDYEEVDLFINRLDEVNEETVLYYLNTLNDIENACDMKQEWKATRNKRNFNTITETDKYRHKLSGLTLSIEDIINFLNYPNEFWNYIHDRYYIVDSTSKTEKDFYGVNMKTKDNILTDIKVFVPYIINLETALVNIHEFKHAYDLYKLLGKKIDIDDSLHEKNAKELELKFKSEYMPLVYKRVLSKK